MKHQTPEHRAKISAACRGRIFSLEHRAKMRLNRLGKPLSPEHYAKICAAVSTPEARARNSRSKIGSHHSEETRAKMRLVHGTPEARIRARELRTGKVLSEETRAKLRVTGLGRHHTPETRAKLRSIRAQQITPFKDTKPEVAVQILLQDFGIEFEKHSHIPGLRHQWDIKIEAQRVLIEVDGCYWHGCPVCKKPRARTNRNDIPCTTFATAAGWTVIRIWECEINKGNFGKLKHVTK